MPIRNNIIVTNNAYKTDAYARPLVLPNGWIIGTVYDSLSSPTRLVFYVSKDNGQSFNQLCYVNGVATGGFSVCNIGTKIYGVFQANGVNTSNYFFQFEAITTSNIEISSQIFDSGQNTFGTGIEIIATEENELMAVWSTSNNTYANKLNVRFRKATLSAEGNAVWETSQDVTRQNISGQNYDNPTVAKLPNNKIIVISYRDYGSSARDIACNIYNGSTWGNLKTIYLGGSYPQGFPKVIYVPKEINGLLDGRIWIAFEGRGSKNTGYKQIKVIYSDDLGVTWTGYQQLTGINDGETKNQESPSITFDKNNNVDIYYNGAVFGYAYNTINYIRYNNGIWGSPVSLSMPSTTSSRQFPSVSRYNNYTNAIVLWQDTPTSSIRFSGDWSLTTISGKDQDFGRVTSFIQNYTIYNLMESALQTTEKINGSILKTYTANTGQSNMIDLSSIWNTLPYGKNTITIECDSQIRVWTFTKVYSNNSKISDIITELQNLTGINQEAELRATLLNKGVDVTSDDGIADMISKLNTSPALKRWAKGTNPWSTTSDGKVSYLISGLSFTPSTVVVVRDTPPTSLSRYGSAVRIDGNFIGCPDYGTSNGGQAGVYAIDISGTSFTVRIVGSSGYNLGGTFSWYAFE